MHMWTADCDLDIQQQSLAKLLSETAIPIAFNQVKCF